MANHSRWCDQNPKRSQYDASAALKAMALARQNSGCTNQYTKARREGSEIPVSHNKGKPGFFAGKNHSESTKAILKQKALQSDHRRLRRKMVDYNGVKLDSSWELALAQRLDEIGVKWIRPAPIKWMDHEGTTHNYFPDFFLPDYDLYLDPKNPYAVEVQKDKIEIITKLLTNLVILYTLEEIKAFAPVPALVSTQQKL